MPARGEKSTVSRKAGLHKGRKTASAHPASGLPLRTLLASARPSAERGLRRGSLLRAEPFQRKTADTLIGEEKNYRVR
jgi:hypothetical protein